MDFNNIQLLKDNSNELNNNNNAKDNSLDFSLDLQKLAQLIMICCSQIVDRQSLLWFCSQSCLDIIFL